MTVTELQLADLDEDWSSALAIVAHPDDMEYGASSVVARWTSQGKRVAYVLATSGEAGIDGMSPAEVGPLREAEQRESCRLVGVSDVEFLGFPDGVIEYGLPLRRAFAGAIRRHRPDVVVTGNHRETYGGTMLNQADHIANGRAVIDAIRDAANRWVFPDLLDAGLEPWGGVKYLLIAGSSTPTHAVNVDEHLAAGVASLRAHAAYLAGLGPGFPEPDEFLESYARMAGARVRCTFAVSFEVFRMGWDSIA
ncbi:PIG-L deacetylase family protein [Saccharopolyspora pogona]|uniref:PIG-L deacetylase family protein n=1 Tax=Saccharopolyspora pogona TaxID=333966 RepID=UPI0016887EF9|nr:PIG-L deacetylase family protein [Saccharopolyspora pogona]